MSSRTRQRHFLFAFLQAVGGGAALGALFGVLYIWQVGYSWSSFFASMLGGAVTGMILGAYLYLADRPSELALGLVGIGAGAAGGATWWFVMQPAVSLLVSSAVGVGIVTALWGAYKLELPI